MYLTKSSEANVSKIKADDLQTEPLLKENPNRFVMFPIKFLDIWKQYITQLKSMWVFGEVDLAYDLKDWVKMNSGQKRFVKHVLAFFASSDGIVLENLMTRFCAEIQIPEVRAFYSTQAHMETIHGIMYSQLLDTYIEDAKEKTKLFESIQTMPIIQKKANWAVKWIQSSERFAVRLVAFAIVEGVFFSGSFCCVYWIKELGLLPGLCKSNDFIARDEGMHTDFACSLYKSHVVNKLSNKELYNIVNEAVSIEEHFINDALPCKLLGMNSELMSQYIRFVANRMIVQLGHPVEDKYKNVTQPFGFMEKICLDNKVNFFEERASEYQMQVEPNVFEYEDEF
jgi:ribonucleoside-diphosphate reductase subunit M2